MMMMVVLLVMLVQVLALGVVAYGLTTFVVRRFADGYLGRGAFEVLVASGDYLVKVLCRY